MRSRFAVVALAIAALFAGALVFSGCGGDDDDSGSTGNRGPGRDVRDQAGDDGQALDHAERPAAEGGHGGGARAVHGRDRHQGRRRGRRLGRPARPHPQRGGLGRGPGRDAGGHHAGAVLRRARRLRGPLGPGRGHRRRERVPGRRLADDRRSSARTARGRSRGSPRRARSTTARTSSRRPASTRRPPFRTGTRSAPRCRRSRTRSPASSRSARRARRRSTSSTT